MDKKYIGLTVESLVAIAAGESAERFLDTYDSVKKDVVALNSMPENKDNQISTEETYKIAKNETLLYAVAKMIEENNKVLLDDLMQLKDI